MDGYDTSHFRYAFESCKTFRDGAVNPSDFSNICRRYKLNYKQVMDQIGTDGEGRYSLDAFIHFMKRYQHSQMQHSHHQSNNYYDQEAFTRPTSPVHRPSSASKVSRQGVYSSASSGHHHTRISSRYPMSPVTAAGVYNDQDNTFTPDDHHLSKRRQDMTRTPDFFLSPEEKMTRTVHERERLRPAEPDHYTHDHRSSTSRSRVGALSRATNDRAIDSPPPINVRRNIYSGRSDKARSFRDEDSEGDDNPESFYPPPAPVSTRSSCKKCKSYARHLGELQEDLKASRSERERLEQSLDAVRKDLRVAQNSDVAYAQIYHENERLKHEVKRLKKDSSMDPDSERAYYDRQYEEMKKVKDDLEEELQRERSTHRHYKRECSALKEEYNNLRLKNEELQRNNWKLKDENQRLSVKLMDDDRSSLVSRRPGDGGSEEHSARSSLAGELSFQRLSAVRQTYHGQEVRQQPIRDSSRSRKSRLEMKRTSSEGKALDEHPTKDETNYTHKAKSHISATSDAGSMVEGFGLSMVSTTPDEQSQVFMVLGEDVSKSVLPEGLPKEKELAMIYALQNCHSTQELIKCLVSYGISTSSDKLQGYQVENEHLKKAVDHLKSKHATLEHSFESSKANMDSMYHMALKVEANNTRMKLAIKLCQQTCEIYEVLLDLRASESRNGGSSTTYFPTFDYSDSIDASTRSPDREAMMIKHSPAYRARSLLHTLEGNPELQRYLPQVQKSRQNSSDYHASHWHPGTLSQNTGTTSGLSSMSGGMEVEISQAEIDRLRLYTQALRKYEGHLVTTLTAMDGLKGLNIVKKNEIMKDCSSSEQGRCDITELEDAAHAEELCKVREEKAELRSQIYMMEQEKRRMELEVSRMLLHQKKTERQLSELHFKLSEERRKRKKERKGRKSDSAIPPHEVNMSELSIEYAAALEREKELGRRYDELFNFMQSHVKDSQCTTEDLMRFVKELRQANSALVDAFEKSKKRQQAEKRRMKQDLVSYMNRVQNSSIPAIEATIPTAPVN